MLNTPPFDDRKSEVEHLRKKVNELEQANNQLHIFKNLFQIVIDAVPALIFWKDIHNNLLGYNKTYEQVFDVPAELPLSKPGYEIFQSSNEHPQHKEAPDPAILQGVPQLNIVEEVITAHKKLFFKTDKIPYLNENGEVLGVICISTDISEQKKDAENKIWQTQQVQQPINEELEFRITARVEELSHKNEELTRKNTDLDNFIYTASHDLKSPIANLEGLITILADSLEGKIDKEDKALIDMLHTAISRFKATISDLTQVTHAQRDSLEAFEPLSFAEIIENVKNDIGQMIEESGAKIIKDIQVPQIQYARKNLRSIIYNLLVNAIKYRSPDKTPLIRIRTRQSSDFVILSVQDNGLGISPDQMKNIFTMFKRIHTHVEGTGLGLYVIKRIVENTGGKIEAESVVGKGTIFKVYFKSDGDSSQATYRSSDISFGPIQ